MAPRRNQKRKSNVETRNKPKDRAVKKNKQDETLAKVSPPFYRYYFIRSILLLL